MPCVPAVCLVWAFAACVNIFMFLISLHWLCTGMDEARPLVHALCSTSVACIPWLFLHASMLTNVLLYSWFHYTCCVRAWTGHAPWYMPYAAAVCLVCRGLCSMFECFNVLVGCRHAQGMQLCTQPVYAACSVAFIASVTGAGWRCPKTLYIHKQCTRTIQNNNFLLQIASNKHGRPQQGIKRKT